jgi:NAD dependent epimerase/dehydratase family enzyme
MLRSAMTMSADRGGAFDVLLGLTRWGLGGTNGDRRQYVSWILEVDFARAVRWLIEHEMEGAVNLAAPGPGPNREFRRRLRRVVPGRLLAAGFAFQFPEWEGAAADLCRRWREGR